MDVTIVITSRERFSHTERSLENYFIHTPSDVPLIYVSTGSPPHIQSFLQRQLELRQSANQPFELIQTKYFKSPNQARNLGLAHVHTKYVVFLDNDTMLTNGWLEALVQCANDTDADIVAPLTLIGELQDQMIHMAGGIIDISESANGRIMTEEHHHADTHLTSLRKPLERIHCDYIEFHCVLMQRRLLDKIGLLDEELLSVHEHIDISLETKKMGGTILLEPASVISYIAPPPCDWADLPFYQLRWSDNWTRRSVEHFKNKWDFSALLYRGDELFTEGEDTIIAWGRGHRRLLAGLEITDATSQLSELDSFYLSALTLALFDSVDRGWFKIHRSASEISSNSEDVDYATLIEYLPNLLSQTEEQEASIVISLNQSLDRDPPALFCLLGLEESARDLLRPLSFLILQTTEGRYDCWVAIARNSWNRSPRFRRLFRQKSKGQAGTTMITLAGLSDSNQCDSVAIGAARTQLFEARVGHLLTASQIEKAPGFSLFTSAILIN